MKKRKRKKEVRLAECSECHRFFDIDELKVLWTQLRLVCGDCFSVIMNDKIQQNGQLP